MPVYQIDVWAGELHQDHVSRAEATEWDDVCAFIQTEVDAGNLCNVLIKPSAYIPEPSKQN